MTTPPNHNTADQSGAMQPTSSASSASPDRMTYEQLFDTYCGQCQLTDELSAKLAEGSDKALLARIAELESDLAEMNRRYIAHTLSKVAAIVPQVVQAPKKLAELIATLSLRVAEQTCCKSDVDLVKEADAALKSLAAPIVATDTEYDGKNMPAGYCTDPNGKIIAPRGKNGDFHYGYDIGWEEGFQSIKGHIRDIKLKELVATVPSEPVAWMAESCGEVAVHKERLPFAANWKPLYAAPSPTEQASDVRNDGGGAFNPDWLGRRNGWNDALDSAIEILHQLNDQSEVGDYFDMAIASIISLKSSPAQQAIDAGRQG